MSDYIRKLIDFVIKQSFGEWDRWILKGDFTVRCGFYCSAHPSRVSLVDVPICCITFSLSSRSHWILAIIDNPAGHINSEIPEMSVIIQCNFSQ
jgi:hypothetical protein